MDNTIQLASPLQFDSIVDGPGMRIVVWTQGCVHQCVHCHNPHTWSMDGGQCYDIGELVQEIQDAQLQTGITLSGGEPFLQAEKLLALTAIAKAKNYNIWAYTGFLYEDICQNEQMLALLKTIDVLVDGPFIESQKDYRLVFKGSKNQRIIDVQASLQDNKLVRSTYDEKNLLLEG